MVFVKGKHSTYLVLLLITIFALLYSCGIKIPNKVPEKVTVNYEKYLEFPLTNLRFSVKDSLVKLENGLRGTGLNLEKTDPVMLSFATEVSLSPSTLLDSLKHQLEDALGDFAESLNFQLSLKGIMSSLSGSFTLPELPGTREFTFNASAVPIDNLTIVQNVPIVVGPTGSVSLSPFLSLLPFDHAIFAETFLRVTFSPSSGSLMDLVLELDGVEIPTNRTIQNLTIRRNSILVLRSRTGNTVSGTLTMALESNRVSYFKNLDLSRVTENGRIRIDIPEQFISIVNEDWQLKLSGKIDGEVTIPGFSGNLAQSLSLKSGGVDLGSGMASGSKVTINVLENYFRVGDGLRVSGYLEFSGTVSADLRQPLTYKVTPNISIKAVKDYRLSVTVNRPNVVSYLKFTSDSGYLVMDFSGLTVRSATTIFGETITAPEVRISFKGVELPKQLEVVLEADVTSSTVSYSVGLSSGQDIKIERAIVDPSLVSERFLELNYPIPDFLKNVIDSLELDVGLLVEYKSKGISLNLDLSSNFFDSQRLNFTDTGGADQQVSIAKKRNIDFSTFTEFRLRIQPSIGSTVEINNVSLREGAYLVLNPKISKLEVDNVSLKNISYDFGNITSVDFGTVLPSEMGFLRQFDYDIDATGRIEVKNSTVSPVIKLNISGTEYVVTKDTPQNVGPKIVELFKNGQRMDVSLKFEFPGGTINKDSALKFVFDVKFPLRMRATSTDVSVSSGELSGDFSSLKKVVDNVSSAMLKFKTWKNTSGLSAKLIIKRGTERIVEREFSTSSPEITLTMEQLRKLSQGGLTYEILIPTGGTVQLNYNGEFFASPYVAVHLNANVEQKLK
ncbi:hypothetical protein [Fervidobacterium thailandense]|uniref:Uncharacterized protein n=1 Tax=Fervidobacterium thailandense TaxID=1008305 RepID=A0A1E3G0V5_9BACT|nr:hypothetical protein [Fervidobacterium thailandense]ODN29780.1 hypothetical protein A4H02_08995 [Fervidobacterium thailandense]